MKTYVRLARSAFEEQGRKLGKNFVGTCLRHVEQDYGSQTYIEPGSEAQTDCQHRKAISLKDEINAAVQRTKLERQIAALERQMNATKQPRRKREIFLELQKLKQ